MTETQANQTLQATAVKRLGWQVGCQRPAVPELFRSAIAGTRPTRKTKHPFDRINRMDRIGLSGWTLLHPVLIFFLFRAVYYP